MAEPIVLGIVSIKNMGEYNSQTQYEKLNVVTYEGSSYCAKQSSIGKLPTNTEYWQLYAEKGDVGDTGAQGPKPEKGVDYFTAEDREEFSNEIAVDVQNEVSEQIGNLTSATPLAASSTSEMIDTTRIYVNTTDGYWYYYNGSTWTPGDIYQSTGIDQDDDIIQSIIKSIGCEKLKITNKDKSIRTSDSTVDIETLYDSDLSSIVELCNPGDVFTINGEGGNSARLFCFTDNSFNVLTRSATNVVANDDVIVAPEDAAYLIINIKNGYAYRGNLTKNKVAENTSDIDKINYFNNSTKINWNYMYAAINLSGNNANLEPTAVDNKWCCAIVECKEGDEFLITGTGGINYRLWAFIDQDNYILLKEDESVELVDHIKIAPVNSKYLIINSSTPELYCYKNNSQIAKNKNDLYFLDKKVELIGKYNNNILFPDLKWERGTINGSGREVVGTTGKVVRTIEKVYCDSCDVIVAQPDYLIQIRIYNANTGASISDQYQNWEQFIKIPDQYHNKNYKMRILCKLKDADETIPTNVTENLSFLIIRNNDYKNVFYDKVYDYTSIDLSSMNSYARSGKLNDLYTIMDNLVANYPEYVTKTLLGYDTSGVYPIYEYRFRPETLGYYNSVFAPETKNEVKLPLVLITGAIHGNEQLGAVIIANFFEKLCSNWDNNKTLEFYRWNIEFRTIVVANPYGFNNNVRENSLNNDPNRQFYKDDATLENICKESLILRNWLNTYKNAALYIDCHTAWAGKDRDIGWLISCYNIDENLFNSVLTALTRKWKNEYSFITYDGLLGYTGLSTYVDRTEYCGARDYAFNYLGIENVITMELANKITYSGSEPKFGQLTSNCYMDIFVNTLNAYMIKIGAQLN